MESKMREEEEEEKGTKNVQGSLPKREAPTAATSRAKHQQQLL